MMVLTVLCSVLVAAPPSDAVWLVDGAAAPAMRFQNGDWPPPAFVDPSGDVLAVGGGTGDLISTTSFGDCRLHVEWRSPPGGAGQLAGNSGVYLQGCYEIQVLGTPASHQPIKANEAGAIYGFKAADHNASTGPGTWQTYDIEFRAPRFQSGTKVQDARVTVYWNGKLVHDDVALPRGTGSRSDRPEAPLGPLVLQDHASEAEGPVHYRNVWIAPLDDMTYEAGDWIDLLEDPDAWLVRGGSAEYRMEDGVLIGQTRPNTPNTFYTSRDTYGDFELEYQVMVDPQLNSGVQIRSHVIDGIENRDGGLRGYQVEIDPSPRAWSAGLYDERRRAWLHPLHVQPQARAAFHQGQWNTIRVVARGPVIRTWINGVPATSAYDAQTDRGHIGFQVHGVGGREDPLEVRFRNVRLRPLTPRQDR